MKGAREKRVVGFGTPVVEGRGICPHCEAALQVELEGKHYCWRCGAPSYVVSQDAQPWLRRIEGIHEDVDPSGDGDERVEIFAESIDPDEGLHGLCPFCGERLFSWFDGRCRCEACEGLFVIHWRRSSGCYQWLIDDERFNSLTGRVRMARRDG